jgi:cold shock CspA family protein
MVHSTDNGGKDVFIHISAVERAGFTGLNEGQKVTYEVQKGAAKAALSLSEAQNGRLRARQSAFYVQCRQRSSVIS